MGDVQAFYDELAPLYHLVYENWDASVARQGGALASLIAERWGTDARSVLDAAVGIGTQALGLLLQGFDVVGSDLSLGAVQRAAREAHRRGLRLRCLVADFRALAARSQSVDVVLIADNSLPHLVVRADEYTARGRRRRDPRRHMGTVRAGGGSHRGRARRRRPHGARRVRSIVVDAG